MRTALEAIESGKAQQAFDDIKAVLEKHYMDDISRPDNDNGFHCWEIMQYVRDRLGLSE